MSNTEADKSKNNKNNCTRKELSKKQLNRLAEVFAISFKGYKLLEFFADHKYKASKMKSLWKMSFSSMPDSSRVFYDNEDFNSAAVMIPTSEDHTGVIKYIFSGGISLIFNMGLASSLRMLRFEDFAGNIKSKYATKNCWYFYVFVTMPEYRGKGIGTKVLTNIIEFLDNRQEDCYLETLSPSNVQYYERYGFELKETVEYPEGNFTIHAMLRTAKKK